MATIQDPQTREALREIGCLAEDGLDNGRFAKLLAERLESEHVAHSMAEVASVEATIGQLVGLIVGRTDEQLVDLARPLLGAGADGRVQKALANGYVLCANRVRIKVDVDGEQKGMSVGTRFLSDDEDVLARYVLGPRQKRADSFVKSTLAITALVGQRQPAMAPRIDSFIGQISITWERLAPGRTE